MFGRNAIAKRRQNEPDLLVREVFTTIQGEGPFTGCPAVFVRLAGCNLRCWFCDTDFDLESATAYTPQRLAAEVRECAVARWGDRARLAVLVITGGEPFLQNVGPLTQNHDFAAVQVETSGSVPVPPNYAPRTVTVVSPKTTSVHATVRDRADHWKYVVGPNDTIGEDGLPFEQELQRNAKTTTVPRPPVGATVWLQPMDVYDVEGRQDPTATAAAEVRVGQLALTYGYRVSLQTHKHLELP